MKRKIMDTIFAITWLALVYEFSGEMIGAIVDVAFLENLNINKSILDILQSYFITVFSLMFFIIMFKVIKRDNFMLKKFNFKNNKILLGLLVGFIANSICVLMAFLNGDLTLSMNNISIGIFLFAFICVFIQCLEEEVLCRLFYYERVKKSYSVKTAIIANTLFFALLHTFNPGMTIIAFISLVMFGLLTSIFVYRFDNIWGAAAVHFSWNFTQNIIYGLPNSGFEAPCSLFKVVKANNSLFYDVSFGIEGTIFSIIILFFSCILVYYLGKKKLSK